MDGVGRGDEEDPHTADRTLAAAATVTLVATDDGGDPVSVPTLTVESEIGQRLADRAARDGA